MKTGKNYVPLDSEIKFNLDFRIFHAQKLKNPILSIDDDLKLLVSLNLLQFRNFFRFEH